MFGLRRETTQRAVGLGGAAWFALVLTGNAAFAAEANAADTAGIKVGNGRLSPFLDLEMRYDSAAGFFGSRTLRGEFVGRARPGLNFRFDGDNHTVGFGGGAEYVWYTGFLSPGSNAASRFQGNMDVGLDLNRQGNLGFQLTDNFLRSDRVATPIFGVGVLSYFNALKIAAPIRPGGGAFEVVPGATWSVEFFDPLLPGATPGCTASDATCNTALVSQLNYSNLTPNVAVKWKFFPKTALVLDAGTDFRLYWKNSALGQPATVFRVLTGISGLLTPKISVVALAGYAQDFVATGAKTVIAQAGIDYFPTNVLRFRLNYNRALNPTPIYGVMIDDRGTAEAALSLAGRIQFKVVGTVDHLTFFSAGRKDLIFGAEAGPTFKIARWFQAGAGYLLTSRRTSLNLPGVNFTRHEAFVRLTFLY